MARPKWKIPFATLAMLSLVAAMLPVLHRAPDLLPLLERNNALLERGELWRALTALFTHGAPLPGVIFNLVILLMIGTVAEQLLGSGRWIAVYLGAGILTEFLALAWQPIGSGNSIAIFGLAGALTMLPGRPASSVQPILRIIALAAGAGLLISRDIHGIGFWSGALINTVLATRDSRRAVLAERLSPSLENGL